MSQPLQFLTLINLLTSSNLFQKSFNEVNAANQLSALALANVPQPSSHFCPKIVQKTMRYVIEPRQEKTVKCLELYKHTNANLISVGRFSDDLNNIKIKWQYDEERMKQVHNGDQGLKDYFARMGKNSDCFLFKKERFKEVRMSESDDNSCCLGWIGEKCNIHDQSFYGFCYENEKCQKIGGSSRSNLVFLAEECCKKKSRNYFRIPGKKTNCHKCENLETIAKEIRVTANIGVIGEKRTHRQDLKFATSSSDQESNQITRSKSPDIDIDPTTLPTQTTKNSSKYEQSHGQTLDRLRMQLNSVGIYIPDKKEDNESSMEIVQIDDRRTSSMSSQNFRMANSGVSKRSTCQTWHGNYYLTFDKRFLTFSRTNCWYLLAKTLDYNDRQIMQSARSNSGQDDLLMDPFWSISIQYTPENKINFKFTVDENTFLVKEEEWFLNGHKLPDNDKKVNMYEIYIRPLSDKSFLLTSSQISASVQFSEKSLAVHLPSNSARGNGRMAGLCGNFNLNPVDDINENMKVSDFVNQYKISGIDPMPCFDMVTSLKRNTRNRDCRNKERICENLNTNPGFKICHQMYSRLPFYESCQDVACPEISKSIPSACNIISNYAQNCINMGYANVSNWRDTVPECKRLVDCPENKIFDECVYSDCQPTCLDVGDNHQGQANSKFYIQNSPACKNGLGQSLTGVSGNTLNHKRSICVPKCRCPTGLIESEDGRCIKPDQCPCLYQNRNYKHGQTITQHCSKCTCKSGKWDCEEKMCTGNCKIVGGQHVKTFDDLKYSITFNSISHKCLEYIVFTIPALKIEFSIKLASAHNSHLAALKLVENGSTYIVEKVQAFPHLTTNYSTSEHLPYRSENVIIEVTSSKSVLIRLFGGTILWIHDESTIYVNIEPVLREKIYGLCGTFDFKSDNDFQTLNGDIESSISSFVARFVNKRIPSCQNVRPTPSSSSRTASRGGLYPGGGLQPPSQSNKINTALLSPCLIYPERLYFAKTLCNAISQTKIFKNCKNINLNNYIEMCEFSACQTDDPRSLCSITASLARECKVNNWRSISGFSNICKPKCPDGMIFEECINMLGPKSSANTCTQLWTTNKYIKNKLSSSKSQLESLSDIDGNFCIPGCKCGSDLVLDDIGDGKMLTSFTKNYVCIPKTACPCLSPDNDNENSIVLAGSVLKRGCIICTCYYGKFNCNSDRCGTEITCPENLRYSEDISACEPKTCKSLRTVSAFSKHYCENAPTYAGCDCPDGLRIQWALQFTRLRVYLYGPVDETPWRI